MTRRKGLSKAEILAFVRQHKLAVLSSVAADDSPQSALVGIAVTSQLAIIFDTVKSSRKYGNLVTRPACSFVIGWEGEQTLQFEGMARELQEPELAGFLKVYFDVWPECRAHLEWADIVYFVVVPTWIRYSDYGQNPPLITTERFSAGSDSS